VPSIFGQSNMFLMRGLKTSLQGPAPSDKVFVRIEGTLSGSSLSVDLSKYFREGAEVEYFVFKKATISSGTITAAAAVAGATDEVSVIIIGNPMDFVMDA